MKTKFNLIVIMCLTFLVVKGQKNVPPFTVESVSVTTPAFTGIENSAKLTPGRNDVYLIEYLTENVELPNDAEKWFAQGTAVIQFIVTSDGKVTNFKIVNSVYPSIDNEIIRVLKTTNGMWKPGYQNEVPVDVEKEIAIMIVANSANMKNPELYFTNLSRDNFKKGSELLLVKKNARKALKYYNSCVKYVPYDTASLIARGLCKYELGDKEGAFSDWKRINVIGRYDVSEYLNEFNGVPGFAEMINILGIN